MYYHFGVLDVIIVWKEFSQIWHFSAVFDNLFFSELDVLLTCYDGLWSWFAVRWTWRCVSLIAVPDAGASAAVNIAPLSVFNPLGSTDTTPVSGKNQQRAKL